MNKKALVEFYTKRYEYLIELSNDSIDLDSICSTPVYDPHIEQKSDNPIMIIGNSPNIDDEHLPFNGRSRKLLYELLESSGLDREKDVVTTNAFPFSISEVTKKGNLTNRATSSMEILIGSLLLIKEIELVQPKIIIALGKTALLALQYVNDQEFINSIEDLNTNYFVISKINSINLTNIVVGTSHYPDMFNIKNPIKRNELLRFFKRVKIIYDDGFEKLKTHKQNGFMAEYDNYSDIREYCEEVAKSIFSENLLPTPRIYEEYFYRLLAKKDKSIQQKIKNSLAIERSHYGRQIIETENSVPDDRKYDSLYRIHSKEYFDQELENEIAKAEIDDTHLSSVLIIKTTNMDKFEEYEKIREERKMIAILKQQTRTNDLITNSDVDTFIVLLSGTTGELAVSVKNRIENALKIDKELKLEIAVRLEFIGQY
jgi:DNA polymerase